MTAGPDVLVLELERGLGAGAAHAMAGGMMREWIEGPCCAGHLQGGQRVGLWWDWLPDGTERLSTWRAGELVAAYVSGRRKRSTVTDRCRQRRFL